MKLRGQTRLARADGRRAVAQVRDECKAARARLIEDARARRVALADAIREEREALRGSCHMRVDRARAATAAAIEEARKTAVHLDKLRRVTRTPAQQAAAERARLRMAERISESDDDVRRQLPRALVSAWEKVKAKIKPSKRATRLERFLEWAEEHAGDIARWDAEEAERGYPEESEESYAERTRLTARSKRASGDEVPF
jgi:hypothetical protein